MSDRVPTRDEEDAALAQRFQAALRSRGSAQPAVPHSARWCSIDALVQFGSLPVLLRIREGAVVDMVVRPPPLSSWTVAIRASAAAWRNFWAPMPAPGWHDLFALAKRGELTLEGDLQPVMANLQFLKDLLAAPRHASVP